MRMRRWWMAPLFVLALALPFAATLVFTDTLSAGPKEQRPREPKPHRIVFQINSEDAAAMRHAITNSPSISTRAGRWRSLPTAARTRH
jgi:hypothetical protein